MNTAAELERELEAPLAAARGGTADRPEPLRVHRLDRDSPDRAGLAAARRRRSFALCGVGDQVGGCSTSPASSRRFRPPRPASSARPVARLTCGASFPPSRPRHLLLARRQPAAPVSAGGIVDPRRRIGHAPAPQRQRLSALSSTARWPSAADGCRFTRGRSAATCPLAGSRRDRDRTGPLRRQGRRCSTACRCRSPPTSASARTS